MADIHVTGTVIIGQQGININTQAPHFHFPSTDEKKIIKTLDTEEAELVVDAATPKRTEHFKYFTAKAIQMKITDALEDALEAACHESVALYKSVIADFTKQELVDMRYADKKSEYDHINALYHCCFSYDYFRKF